MGYDLAIIGGGILGTGVVREAALRGLKVALFEQNDFGSGTSSRSTRIIHGGLRYLEKLDFGLVYEALHERRRLLANAPHLVKPLPFLLPVYRRKGHPFTILWAGIGLYDVMNLRRGMPHHRFLAAKDTRRLEPALRREGLRGGFLYFDAQCEYPERLCVENVVDAAAHGARIENHARVVGLLRSGDRVEGVRVRRLDGSQEDVQASVTLTASGPWLDEVEKLYNPQAGPQLRRTKGVHLVVPRFTQHSLIMETEDASRVFFAIPWGDYTLLGTTDTDYEGPNETVAADDEDIDYLLREIRNILNVKLEREHIHYTTAGLRPLRREMGRPTADISRRHEIVDHHVTDGIEGLVTIVGGKITTFRQIAEDAVDEVYRKLGKPPPPSPTRDAPMPGGQTPDWTGFQETFRQEASEAGVSQDVIRHWLRIYGTRSREILKLATADEGLLGTLMPGMPYLRAEVALAVEEEFCGSLEDFLLRRSMWGLQADQGVHGLTATADELAARLGWDGRRRDTEIAAYRETLARMRSSAENGAGSRAV